MADGWQGVHETQHGLAFSCPASGCYYHVGIKSLDADTTHNCPHIGGKSTYAWSVTVSIVEEIWEMLDREVASIKDGAEHSREWHKSRATALADVLVKFMSPIFTKPDQISREALKRYQAKKDGTEHVTPGIRHAIYKTLGDGEAWYKAPDGGWTMDPGFEAGPPAATISETAMVNRIQNVARDAREEHPPAPEAPGRAKMTRPVARTGGSAPVRRAAAPTSHNLTDEEVATIKGAYSTGMFTLPQLAKTYKVSEDVIRLVLSI